MVNEIAFLKFATLEQNLFAAYRKHFAWSKYGLGLNSFPCYSEHIEKAYELFVNISFVVCSHLPVIFFHLSENKELLDTVNKQRQMLEDLRKKEIEAYVQVKKSCELAEQAQLDKHEVR